MKLSKAVLSDERWSSSSNLKAKHVAPRWVNEAEAEVSVRMLGWICKARNPTENEISLTFCLVEGLRSLAPKNKLRERAVKYLKDRSEKEGKTFDWGLSATAKEETNADPKFMFALPAAKEAEFNGFLHYVSQQEQPDVLKTAVKYHEAYQAELVAKAAPKKRKATTLTGAPSLVSPSGAARMPTEAEKKMDELIAEQDRVFAQARALWLKNPHNSADDIEGIQKFAWDLMVRKEVIEKESGK